MRTLLIHEQFANPQEMANTLRVIADLIEQDYVCGYYPAWEIKEETRTDSDKPVKVAPNSRVTKK